MRGGDVAPHDELLDLVDPDDRVIGQLPRSEVYRRGLSNFRAVNAFLRNGRGQLWIPLRSASKRLFPLSLDASVGGHVASGESYETAFRRELWEELNLDFERVEWRLLGYLTPHRNGVSAFMKVYEIRTDDTPSFNPADFCGWSWAEPCEVLARIVAGTPSKDDLPRLLGFFYGSQGQQR